MLFEPSMLVLGEVWKSDFVAIYVIPALFCYALKGLQSRFGRYLPQSRPLLPRFERFAKPKSS
jgi:hypothetical protein